MEDDDVERTLSSLIDLVEASHELPPPLQHKFFSLDRMYRLDAQYLADRTMALLRYLLSFVLDRKLEDSENIDDDVSQALDVLLSSGFEFLDEYSPPPPRIIEPNIITKRILGLDVVLSDNIVKPAKFFRNEKENPLGLEMIEVPNFDVRKLPDEIDDRNVIFIGDSETLEELCSVIISEPVLYISVEMHRVHTYRPFPCIISIFVDMKFYVIDILKIRSSNGLRILFANPEVVKVIYDANSVLTILWECLQVSPSAVYDPLLALQLVDVDKGYDEVLELYSIEVKKVLFDWRIRPLPQRFIRAAVNKVWKLPIIAEISQRDLDKKMILNLMNNSIDYTFQPYKFDSQRCLERLIMRFGEFDEQSSAAALALLKWRDGIAFQEDVCPNLVMPDHTLVALARQCPKTPHEIEQISDIVVTPLMKSYHQDICTAVQSAIGTGKIIDM